MNNYLNEIKDKCTKLNKKELINLIYKIKNDIYVYRDDINYYNNLIEKISDLFVQTPIGKLKAKRMLLENNIKNNTSFRFIIYIIILSILFNKYYLKLSNKNISTLFNKYYSKLSNINPFKNKKRNIDLYLSYYDLDPDSEGYYCYTINKIDVNEPKSSTDLAKKAMCLLKERIDLKWGIDSYIGVNDDYITNNEIEEEAKILTNKEREARFYNKIFNWCEKRILKNKFPIKKCYKQGNNWENEFKENLKKLEERPNKLTEEKQKSLEKEKQKKLEKGKQIIKYNR